MKRDSPTVLNQIEPLYSYITVAVFKSDPNKGLPGLPFFGVTWAKP